jgi:hypothetical protein
MSLNISLIMQKLLMFQITIPFQWAQRLLLKDFQTALKQPLKLLAFLRVILQAARFQMKAL